MPKKFQRLLRWLAPLTFLIHVQAFQNPLRGELPHVHIFMNDGPNLLTWDARLLSYWLSQNPSVFQDYLVNLFNNLLGGHCFGSSRTRCNTGGKITTFKLGHPVFDGGIRWCMFPWCFCQNGVNFLGTLPCRKKKTWWQLESLCCWNRAHCLTCFPLASVTSKDLQFGTWTYPFFQRHYRFHPTTSGSKPD